jgi:hypothetical protein
VGQVRRGARRSLRRGSRSRAPDAVPEPRRCSSVGVAALFAAERSAHPRRAPSRASLRHPNNGPTAIAVGTRLSLDAAQWLEIHASKPSRAFVELPLERDTFDRYVHAGHRCALEAAPRWLDAAAARGEPVRPAELTELEHYCQRAITELLAARDSAELPHIIESLDPTNPFDHLGMPASDCRGYGADAIAKELSDYSAVMRRL